MLTKFRRAVARALDALANRIDPDAALGRWFDEHPDGLADLMALLDQHGPTQDDAALIPASCLVRTGGVTRAALPAAPAPGLDRASADRLAAIDDAQARAVLFGETAALTAADRWAEAHLRAQVAALGG